MLTARRNIEILKSKPNADQELISILEVLADHIERQKQLAKCTNCDWVGPVYLMLPPDVPGKVCCPSCKCLNPVVVSVGTSTSHRTDRAISTQAAEQGVGGQG